MLKVPQPGTYQSVVDHAIRLAGLSYCCCTYLDDLLIHTSKGPAVHTQDIIKCLEMRCNILAHRTQKSVYLAATSFHTWDTQFPPSALRRTWPKWQQYRSCQYQQTRTPYAWFLGL